MGDCCTLGPPVPLLSSQRNLFGTYSISLMETGTYLFLKTNLGEGRWGKEPVEAEDEQSPGDSNAGSEWVWHEPDA